MDATLLSRALSVQLGIAKTYAPHLTSTMLAYSIFTPEDQAMFLAQIAHESAGLYYTSEIWGPTGAQLRYENRADLGNVQPGDGVRYKGHGLLQITGRSNHAAAYARMRDFLGGAQGLDVPNFEETPTELCKPLWASYSAGDYWYNHGLSSFSNSLTECTRRINGGYNGLVDRKNRLDRTRRAFGLTPL